LKLQTKDITYITLFAALYVVLVIIFAPFSFYAIQFRLAGILRPGIAKKRILVVGYGIGVFISNFFSPFAGFHELVFMPIMALISGIVSYEIAKNYDNSYVVVSIIIAIIIALSISLMLNQLFLLPIMITLPSILFSEITVNILGVMVYKLIDMRVSIWF